MDWSTAATASSHPCSVPGAAAPWTLAASAPWRTTSAAASTTKSVLFVAYVAWSAWDSRCAACGAGAGGGYGNRLKRLAVTSCALGAAAPAPSLAATGRRKWRKTRGSRRADARPQARHFMHRLSGLVTPKGPLQRPAPEELPGQYIRWRWGSPGTGRSRRNRLGSGTSRAHAGRRGSAHARQPGRAQSLHPSQRPCRSRRSSIRRDVAPGEARRAAREAPPPPAPRSRGRGPQASRSPPREAQTRRTGTPRPLSPRSRQGSAAARIRRGHRRKPRTRVAAPGTQAAWPHASRTGMARSLPLPRCPPPPDRPDTRTAAGERTGRAIGVAAATVGG